MDSLPGYEIEVILGEVVGLSFAGRDVYRSGIKDPETGENADLGQVLVENRRAATAHMIAAARRLGANAILAQRFLEREVTSRINETVAYGTAVIVRPLTPKNADRFAELED